MTKGEIHAFSIWGRWKNRWKKMHLSKKAELQILPQFWEKGGCRDSQDQQRSTWGPLKEEFSFSQVKRRIERTKTVAVWWRKKSRQTRTKPTNPNSLWVKKKKEIMECLKGLIFKPCFADQGLKYVIISPYLHLYLVCILTFPSTGALYLKGFALSTVMDSLERRAW